VHAFRNEITQGMNIMDGICIYRPSYAYAGIYFREILYNILHLQVNLLVKNKTYRAVFCMLRKKNHGALKVGVIQKRLGYKHPSLLRNLLVSDLEKINIQFHIQELKKDCLNIVRDFLIEAFF